MILNTMDTLTRYRFVSVCRAMPSHLRVDRRIWSGATTARGVRVLRSVMHTRRDSLSCTRSVVSGNPSNSRSDRVW